MPRVDVRRLAAVDMHGARGTSLRRRLIVAEFLLGAVGGVLLGALVAASGSSLGFSLFGAWIATACLNYVPLAIHAVSLLPDRRLEAALAGVDIPGELRYYTKAQLWITVPLLFIALDLQQRRRRTAS